MIKKLIYQRIKDSISVKEKVLLSEEIHDQIENLAMKIVDALENKKKVIFAGNGGSFADAFHLAGEFVSRFLFDRPALASIALGGNNSIITAVGNDYSYNDIFSREMSALGNKDDIFIPISTSGNSSNILEAIKTAKDNGLIVIGFTGQGGGEMKKMCKCICIPSEQTPRIQESHILIGHILCEIVEEKLFG